LLAEIKRDAMKGRRPTEVRVIRPINQGKLHHPLTPSHTLISIGRIEVSIATIAVTRFVITVLCDSLGNGAPLSLAGTKKKEDKTREIKIHPYNVRGNSNRTFVATGRFRSDFGVRCRAGVV
jgi:hypothetical protein